MQPDKRAIVHDRLSGFEIRHALRKLERKFKLECAVKPEEQEPMKNIKLSFRAVFEQPLGPLNPMGLKMPGPVAVEIFGNGDKWKARYLLTRTVLERLYHFANPLDGRRIVEAAFNRQVEAWQAWGTPPSENQDRMIMEDEYVILPTGWFYGFKGPEDYTHIIHAPKIPPGAKIPPAACGASVNAKCFISTKANVQPSCRKCAEVWLEHYQEKHA